MEIDETDGYEGHDGHIYRLKKMVEIQDKLFSVRELNEKKLV